MYDPNSLGFGPDCFDRDAMKREKRLVQMTLEALGLEADTAAIRRTHSDATDEKPRLSFLGFRRVIERFPIALTYENLYKLTRHTSCTHRALLAKPSGSIIAERYSDCRLDLHLEATGRPVGMIFPCDRIRGGLIIHNADLPTLSERRGSQLSWLENGEPRRIERYTSVLYFLKQSHWQRASRSPSFKSDGFPDLTWLMQTIPDHASLRVILFFVNLSYGPTNADSDIDVTKTSIVRFDGYRWFAVRQSEIAKAICLGIDRVKRAVRKLRSNGWLVVGRTGRDNAYRLSDFAQETLSKS